jgi:hypothetical protein
MTTEVIGTMRKTVISFLCGTLLSLTTVAAASDTIQAFLFPAKLQINGVEKQPADGNPVLNYNGSVYVPLRFVAEALGSKVSYEEETKTVMVRAEAPASTSAKALKVQPLETLEVDLDLDGTKEIVELVADVSEEGAPFAWRILVDGGLRAFLTQPEDGMYGPVAHMETNDLTGDGKPELLVYRYNTGTAGAIGLTVYEPSVLWRAIFAVSDPFRFDGLERMEARYGVRYLGNLEVEFTDKETGLKAVIPQSLEKYKGIPKKELEPMLEKLHLWVDPVSFYKITDDDKDGRKEIVTQQRVIGIGHPDTLALLENVYWLGEDQSYRPVKQKVYDYKENVMAEQSRKQPLK